MTSVPSWTRMLACCGVKMTRSALNRPSARMAAISVSISFWTLPNTPQPSTWPWLPVGPGEDHLAAQTALHGGERRLIIRHGEPVRDHAGDIDARLDQHCHLVPGLKHLPPVDPPDRDHVQDQVSPVDGELAGGQPEQGDLAAVPHRRQHAPQCLRLSRHLQADVESLAHAKIPHGVTDRGLSDIEGNRNTDPA